MTSMLFVVVVHGVHVRKKGPAQDNKQERNPVMSWTGSGVMGAGDGNGCEGKIDFMRLLTKHSLSENQPSTGLAALPHTR